MSNRLDVAAELIKLRELITEFDIVVADARRVTDECNASLARFMANRPTSDNDIDFAIDRLDRLAQRGRYAVCDHSAGNYGTQNGLRFCLDCDGVLPDDDVDEPAMTQYRVTTCKKNVYLIAAHNAFDACEKCDAQHPGETSMIVSLDSEPGAM